MSNGTSQGHFLLEQSVKKHGLTHIQAHMIYKTAAKQFLHVKQQERIRVTFLFPSKLRRYIDWENNTLQNLSGVVNTPTKHRMWVWSAWAGEEC